MRFLTTTMNKIFPVLGKIGCFLALAIPALAQPLPSIALQPVFPNLQIDRPVWLGEAPDGSGRLFAVAQAGTILVFKKGSDGSDAKEFLTSSTAIRTTTTRTA
jgi:hypothetical protein